MEPVELKVARIGNSRGVRLPAETLERYNIGESVIMEERDDGILLRPSGLSGRRLSWAETAAQMAASDEDWSEWDSTAEDGMSNVVWNPEASRRVAEPKRKYPAKGRRPK
jgi:antitoxin component of MazEF toxin-antitoxin module